MYFSKLMNFKTFILFCLVSCIYAPALFSQGGFARKDDWKKYRQEAILSVGASQFLGDLGGLNKVGTDYSPVDIEFVLTRPAASAAYRYKFAKNFGLHAGFNYLLVSGDDKLTQEQFRNNRNLNFKSNIFELAVRAEYCFFTNQVGHRYNLKNTRKRRMSTKANEFMIFVGVGGFYFNPKGRNPVTGRWEKLHRLHTEGQGLPGGPKQYRRISLSIPIGIAWRCNLNRYWNIGLELSYRKTFTDYIDDVHGSYYPDRALQASTYGATSVLLADPSLGHIPNATANNGDGTGAQRGDKEKDAYMSIQITVGRYFPPKRKKSKLRSKF